MCTQHKIIFTKPRTVYVPNKDKLKCEMLLHIEFVFIKIIGFYFS